MFKADDMTEKKKDQIFDEILPEAFAVCREASWRVLGMKHFRVQVIGGIILHRGRISEMKTGEGKTLVATLPAYLNALAGDGVHVVTVNEYLAKRDAEWMGKLYRFLGLTVGILQHDSTNEERKAAYNSDITYATNNELGFDYLRDNMVVYKENKVQRGHTFAIVDEVDSILIDEARTPLIISGQGDKSTDLYQKADELAKTMKCKKIAETDAKEDNDDEYIEEGIDYIVDEKAKTATLTPVGVKKAEKFFGIDNLTDPDNITIQHHINQAIKAHGVMKRDIEYVVNEKGEVIIVDEFTGRLMYGRRYNEGLHQAIEAKEGVKVERESKTLATITFQNFFRLYKKLSGMTGTAMTEETEFSEIYRLDVIEIPTNKPVIRIDRQDQVYKNEHFFTSKKSAILSQLGIDAIEFLTKPINKEYAKSKHFDPAPPISTLIKYAEDYVSIGNQTGEGWFLVGEMVELIHSGAPNIVCTQPFGCLPNHIVGKGVIKELRRTHPEANIVAIDYDPGASEVNQLNRIKLMLSAAVKKMK